MVDWTSGLADASVAERDSGFVVVRIPGTPDVLKEAAISGFATKDASGNLVTVGGTVASAIGGSGANIQLGRFAMYSTALGGAYVNYGGEIRSFSGAGIDVTDLRFYTSNGTGSLERGRFDSLGNFMPGVTNAQDLGIAGKVWRNGYIQNAWTVTSDADLKHRGAALSDAEITAGKRIAAELCWWQWLDSIATKGEEARNHFGPMAQDIAQILVECDVELDWADGKPSFRSDMLCWDEWDAVTQPVMADRIVQKTKIVLVPVDGSDDGTGEPFYKREEITVDEVEQYDTGAVEIVRPAGSEWRIDPSQVAFFLIAAINADTERRLALLEGAKS
jgi:hypothetical protein